jgi:amidase
MSDRAPLEQLGVRQALELLRAGDISAEALVRACLDRIDEEEPRVLAWEHLDRDAALAEARRVDGLRPRPPLLGLPVAVKDIIDTADMPTACGSPIHRGRRPAADAAAVAALRSRGAVILGKTVTTEFAYFTPGKTRNPRDPSRTPGGSSSGSAAAVAARMVPAALGTQTAGSIIRPAAYCGVVGFKPTHGTVPLDGVSLFAPSLDTLGLFVRAVEDVAPVLEAMTTAFQARPARAAPPRVGLCRTEQWPLADDCSRAVVEESARRLERAGAAVREIDLGPEFVGLADAQRTVMAAEAARIFEPLRREHDDQLSPVLRNLLDTGASTFPERHRAALAQAERCRGLLPRVFEAVDVLLTPSAMGEAPAGLSSTGDPAFNRIWTLLHLPCVTLPAGVGPHRMPLGVQAVGPLGGDGELLAHAGWLERQLHADGGTG